MKETKTDRTNKELLVNGLKLMSGALACMFVGPTLVYISQTQLRAPIDSIMLVLAILICGLAIYLAFKGINTIMGSMFKNK